MQQHPQEPITTLLYRVESVEKDVVQLKTQLNLYEPIRESDLKLSRINDIVVRIETDLKSVKEKVEDIAEDQSRLQIRTLWYIVTTIVTILSALLIGYLTHIIH